MKLYSTKVDARGGRSGMARSTDGRLEVSLSIPKEIGGDGGRGTNPEQLFAAGYSACFESAVRLVARKRKLPLADDSGISAEVALTRSEAGLFVISVVLEGHFPGLDHDTAATLMKEGHEVCPYSNATRGNIDVELRLRGETAPLHTATAGS